MSWLRSHIAALAVVVLALLGPLSTPAYANGVPPGSDSLMAASAAPCSEMSADVTESSPENGEETPCKQICFIGGLCVAPALPAVSGPAALTPVAYLQSYGPVLASTAVGLSLQPANPPPNA